MLEPDLLRNLTWGLMMLAALGGEVERRERLAWREAPFASSPEDGLVGVLWERWSSGEWAASWRGSARGEQPASAYWKRTWQSFCARQSGGQPAPGWAEAWRCLLLSEMFRGVHAALRGRGVPADAAQRLQAEWDENLTIHMMGGGFGVPMQSLLAARIMESTGDGPIIPLVQLLSARGRAVAGHCLARRGSRRHTTAWLYSDVPDFCARAEILARRMERSPSAAECFLDAHCVRTLLVNWSSGRSNSTSSAWDTILQHRLRARSRLRAVLAHSARDALLKTVPEQAGLYTRLCQALRLLGRSWAHDSVAWTGDRYLIAGGWHVPLAPSCQDEDPDLVGELPGDALPDLQAWLFLVVLRGRLRHLLDWLRQGGLGEDDGRWNRLRSAIPAAWTPTSKGSRRNYAAVRVSLSIHLHELIRPVPALVSGFVAQDGSQRALQQWLEERWPGSAILREASCSRSSESGRLSWRASSPSCTGSDQRLGGTLSTSRFSLRRPLMMPSHDDGALLDYLDGALEPGRAVELEEELYCSRQLRERLQELAGEALGWRIRGHRLAGVTHHPPARPVEVQRLAAGSGMVVLRCSVAGLPDCTLRLSIAQNTAGDWDHDACLFGIEGLKLPFAVHLRYAPDAGLPPVSCEVDVGLGVWWSAAEGPGSQPELQAYVVDVDL